MNEAVVVAYINKLIIFPLIIYSKTVGCIIGRFAIL